MSGKINYRTMIVEDVGQVHKVEERTFNNPWSQATFDHEIRNNRFATYLVAETDSGIVGYCGIWVVFEDAHITNVAVLPEYRGQKIGETLMRKAILLAKMRKAQSMSLEVRVSNEAAQSLYQKLGFQKGGIRKSYYTDNLEDALVMWVKL